LQKSSKPPRRQGVDEVIVFSAFCSLGICCFSGAVYENKKTKKYQIQQNKCKYRKTYENTDDSGQTMHEEFRGILINKQVMHIGEKNDNGGYKAESHAAARRYKAVFCLCVKQLSST